MGTLMRHGNEQQKRAFLPRVATGELRLQAFAVSEADAGSDTLQNSDTRRTDCGRLPDFWSKDLDLESRSFRPDDLACADDSRFRNDAAL